MRKDSQGDCGVPSAAILNLTYKDVQRGLSPRPPVVISVFDFSKSIESSAELRCFP